MAGALSGAEWLQAARALLGHAADQELRLLDVQPDEQRLGAAGECVRVAVRVRGSAGGDERRALFLLKALGEALGDEDGLAFHKEAALLALFARLGQRLRAGALQPWGARCLLARPPHLLLFEDLGAQGFRGLGARESLDFAHCAAALDALARLHATSLALEEADRRARRLSPWRLGDRFPDALQELQYASPPPRALAHALRLLPALLDRMRQFSDSPRRDDILRRLEALPQLASALVQPSDSHRNAVCHGHPVVANVLFRYSSWGQVEEARLVEVRRARFAPPALDVAALLHCCARRALREARGAELRDVYHAALARALASAGFSGGDALLPRAAFDASWDDCAPFGAVAAACALPFALLPDAPADDADAADAPADALAPALAAFERDADYRERVGEALAELVHEVLLRK